jgi:hypothetical protein
MGDSDTVVGVKVRVGDVVRPLFAVYDAVENGNRVVFDSEDCGGGYCLNKKTGEKHRFEVRNRTWELKMNVKPFKDLPKKQQVTKLNAEPLKFTKGDQIQEVGTVYVKKESDFRRQR